MIGCHKIPSCMLHCLKWKQGHQNLCSIHAQFHNCLRPTTFFFIDDCFIVAGDDGWWSLDPFATIVIHSNHRTCCWVYHLWDWQAIWSICVRQCWPSWPYCCIYWTTLIFGWPTCFFFSLFKHALHRPFNILSTFSLSHRWTIVFVKTSDGADRCPHCGTASCKGYSCTGARNIPGASWRLGESICSQEWHCVPWQG